MNNNFCVWRYVTRNGKQTKIPYNPLTEHRGKSNDPSMFSTLNDAQDVIRKHPHNYDGIGIGIFANPGSSAIAAVDIDGCVSSDKKLSETATKIISLLKNNVYVEYSPSGKGIHILFTVPSGFTYDKAVYYIKSPKSHVEVYVPGMTNRFITYTGQRISGNIDDLPDCSLELLAVLDTFMKRHDLQKSFGDLQKSSDNFGNLQKPNSILKIALKNQKFFKLFNGNISEYGSHSEADLALCNMLAWWTNGNADEIDSLFRQSALMREKWLRDDYREATIQKSLAGYNPHRSRESGPETAKFYEPIFHKLHSQTLNMGRWNISEHGISYTTPKNHDEIFVSATPVVPATCIENADTGIHKTELHFLYNHTYRTAIFNNDVLASRNKVVELSNVGINVTTTTAREFVDYIQEIISMNADKIPHAMSVSRLGWVSATNKLFVPYDTNIIFDGEAENRSLFQAVSPSGTLDAWIDAVRPLRSNLILRLTMAASFASPLIELCGALPFIFHLWGKTGAGKTVALMVAMSIWGNPRLGKLTYTMNMTDNALMTTAGGLYSIPFAGDELQLIKSTFGYDKLIMRVTEGIERGRMNYNEKLPQRVWRNAFIFTGEEPCTNDHSGAGAKNRVIEIPVNNTVIVENGPEAVSAVETNYGVCGYHYIEFVKSHPPTALYSGFYRILSDTCDSTGKQAMAAALILTGDELARQAFFPDEHPLSADDIIPFMKTDAEIDISARSAEYISEWIIVNKACFQEDSQSRQIYGRIDGLSVYIINSVLKDALSQAGFSFDSVKDGWEDAGFLIRSPTGKFSFPTRVSGSVTRCVHLKLSTDD